MQSKYSEMRVPLGAPINRLYSVKFILPLCVVLVYSEMRGPLGAPINRSILYQIKFWFLSRVFHNNIIIGVQKRKKNVTKEKDNFGRGLQSIFLVRYFLKRLRLIFQHDIFTVNNNASFLERQT